MLSSNDKCSVLDMNWLLTGCHSSCGDSSSLNLDGCDDLALIRSGNELVLSDTLVFRNDSLP